MGGLGLILNIWYLVSIILNAVILQLMENADSIKIGKFKSTRDFQ